MTGGVGPAGPFRIYLGAAPGTGKTVAMLASWYQLHDEDLIGALIEFARGKQVTQIVVGASQRSRWQEPISGGPTVRRVSRLAAKAGIDVLIVAPQEAMLP